jgi:hypothetical protein
MPHVHMRIGVSFEFNHPSNMSSGAQTTCYGPSTKIKRSNAAMNWSACSCTPAVNTMSNQDDKQ